MTEDTAGIGLCELVSLGGLGALDGNDVWRFREHLLECPGCRAELEMDDGVVAMLAYAAEPVAPSPILRFRLFDEIQGRSKPAADQPHDRSKPMTHEVPYDAASGWKPYPIPGVAYRRLHVDKVKGEILMLVRAEAGSSYPTHNHSALEEMFMLEGELDFSGTVYKAGDYIRSECGSTHAASETRTGCMFLLRASLQDQMLSFN